MYLSPTPKHIAFDTHFDMFDFLVVQIHGEKRWRVYEPTIPDPVFGVKRSSYKEEPNESKCAQSVAIRAKRACHR